MTHEIKFKWDYYGQEGPFNEDLEGVFEVEQYRTNPRADARHYVDPSEWMTKHVTLKYLIFGGAKIDRDTSCKMYGKRTILKVEQWLEELEQYG